MATYTKLSDADLTEVSQSFALGEIYDVTPYSQGSENSNFQINTEKGTFVLTVCESKTVTEVQRLIDTLRHLEKEGFRTTRLVPTVDGSFQSSLPGKPLLLKSYLEGTVYDTMPLSLQCSLGAELGRLHCVSVPDFLPRHLNYGVETFERLRVDFGKPHPFLDWLNEIESYMAPVLALDLPTSIVHSDVFADNVVCHPDQGPVIMDFEEAAVYYRMFDVGMTVVGTCRLDGKIESKWQTELLLGYREVVDLTLEEEGALTAFIVYAAASMASWRFRQFNMVLPELGKQEHYRELQSVAISALAK